MKKIILLLFFVQIGISSFGQWTMGIGMAGASPLLDFKEKGYNNGLGYSLCILSKPFPNYYNWQLQMGGNLNHFWTGNKKQEITLAEPTDAAATYKIRNNNTAISFKTRLISRPNPIRFHADLDLGYRSFSSRESIVLNEVDTNYSSRFDTTLISTGNVFVGLTVGVMFQISKSFYLDLYSRVDYGFSTKWYDLNSFSIISDIPQYDNYTYNKTHTPILWVGFTASFNIKRDERTKAKSISSGSNSGYQKPNTPAKPKQTSTRPKQKPKPLKPKTLPSKPSPGKG